MKLISAFLITFSLSAFAYKPTVESLFRNGSNGEIGQNTVMATFVLQKKLKTEELESSDPLKKLPSIHTYKMLFGNEKENSPLVQVTYRGSVASGNTISDVRYFPRSNFSALRLGQEDTERKFFYALLASLINNKGDLMVKYLNDVGVGVQPNNERVDKEQLYYLGRYVKFLKSGDDSGQENPLEPSDSDSAQKIREVFKRPFLTPSPYVRRIKEGPDFFWVLESEKVYAKFSHDDHKLLEMNVQTENGTIGVKCLNYILYGQDLQFPELVILKDLAGDEYMLNMKKITQFSDSSERFSSRIEDYQKALQKNPKTPEQVLKPSFTL